MDILQLLQDYGVSFQTQGHKHCRPGWANMPCPFCTGNPGLHLGVNLQTGHFYCWRCGYHSKKESLCRLLNMTPAEVQNITKNYGGTSRPRKIKRPYKKKQFKMPSGCGELTVHHKKYLTERGFDAEKIGLEWNLFGTGPVSFLDEIDYKLRIIAPIYWNGKVVSFQGRDITNKSGLKYKACPQVRELMDHQSILYGAQPHWKEVGICVEGITDVWRLGLQSFGVFGIEYTLSQVNHIAKHFKRVVVVFDDDPQAVLQAKKLVGDLRVGGVRAHNLTITGDPGEMSQDDANHLVKDILKWR